MAFGLH
jgi:hypothetical protein